jgi:hypothetical protein
MGRRLNQLEVTDREKNLIIEALTLLGRQADGELVRKAKADESKAEEVADLLKAVERMR